MRGGQRTNLAVFDVVQCPRATDVSIYSLARVFHRPTRGTEYVTPVSDQGTRRIDTVVQYI
jgi:hypothetical protein